VRHETTIVPGAPPPHQPIYYEEISKHLETFLGPVTEVYHETVSEYAHIDVLHFPPRAMRNHWTFVTCGMSDLPMAVPAGFPNPSGRARAELTISLPANWFDGFGTADPTMLDRGGRWWPIGLLKYAALVPCVYKTWLWVGHTMALAEPPQPFDANTQFCAFMTWPPLRWPEQAISMVAQDRQTINFLAVFPLYQDELDFKLNADHEVFLDLLKAARISELLDPYRSSIVSRN